MKSLAFAVAFVVCASLIAQGQQPAARIDLTRLGPQEGQVVPDFRLQDAAGKIWTRDSVMGANGAMIVSWTGARIARHKSSSSRAVTPS